MKIDGKEIANNILADLKQKVDKLKEKGITPHLYIITFGENPNTESYLKQKLLRADQIGAKVTIKRFDLDIDPEVIVDLIDELNANPDINGIIVQRPLPNGFDEEEISTAINPKKDVDGFYPNSPFAVPVASAVFELLKNAGSENFENKNIVLAGKGVTAGKPIRDLFAKKNIKTTNVDSKTIDENEIFKNADIIVSAVGKTILNKENIKKGAILVGVGMHAQDNHLKGDYEDSDIENVASFYTPTPGGVGPVNVTMLMKNLVTAAENQTD